MKTTVLLTLRTFPVTVRDERTNETTRDTIVLTKEQLRAADLVGQSSKELIYRRYNRQGFKVLEIGKPEKRDVILDLAALVDKGE